MKKLLTISLMAMLICTLSACSDGNSESSPQSSESSGETSQAVQTDTPETTQPETEQSAETETTEAVQTTAEVTTEAVTKVTTAVTTESSSTDVSDGIILDTPVEETSDEEFIALAQALFESACRTEWNYTVGSPYEIDMSMTAPNQFGWDCYLITAEGINSLADVRADYHRVFSENYADTLDEVFTESGGRVYCLNGARGADIFYEKSVVTAVNSRSESEISFTVQNYYSGDDFGNEPYTSDEEFVISADSDGAWRVSKFRMPY